MPETLGRAARALTLAATFGLLVVVLTYTVFLHDAGLGRLLVSLALLGLGIAVLLASRRALRHDHDPAPAAAADVAPNASERERDGADLLGILAHDLRNPLSPLRTSMQLLRLGPTDPARTRELVDVADRQVGELVRQLDKLGELAAIARGRLALQREPTDLALLAGDAIESIASSPGLQRHPLSVAPGIAALPYAGDARLLAHALAALIEHAAQEAAPGAGLEIELQRDDRASLVHVREQAAGGVATARPARNNLAIALARAVARLHGGTVDPEPAGTAGWVLRLPHVETATPD